MSFAVFEFESENITRCLWHHNVDGIPSFFRKLQGESVEELAIDAYFDDIGVAVRAVVCRLEAQAIDQYFISDGDFDP